MVKGIDRVERSEELREVMSGFFFLFSNPQEKPREQHTSKSAMTLPSAQHSPFVLASSPLLLEPNADPHPRQISVSQVSQRAEVRSRKSCRVESAVRVARGA